MMILPRITTTSMKPKLYNKWLRSTVPAPRKAKVKAERGKDIGERSKLKGESWKGTGDMRGLLIADCRLQIGDWRLEIVDCWIGEI
jgi:hypothetical protein